MHSSILAYRKRLTLPTFACLHIRYMVNLLNIWIMQLDSTYWHKDIYRIQLIQHVHLYQDHMTARMAWCIVHFGYPQFHSIQFQKGAHHCYHPSVGTSIELVSSRQPSQPLCQFVLNMPMHCLYFHEKNNNNINN